MESQEILVLVCAGCGACDEAIMAELAALEQQSELAITVRMEDCLDTCESEPSFMVDFVSIAPATPEKLRRAIMEAKARRTR